MRLKTISNLGILFFLCVSCSQEKDSPGLGSGSFSLSLKTDYEVIPVLRSTTADVSTTPTIDDFAICLTKEDGSYSKEWSCLENIPSDATFDVGSYTLRAYSGDLGNEGFDSPFYEGETSFVIRDKETTPVEVICRLGHVKISICYTDAFCQYFSDYSTTVRSEGGKDVVFTKEESRDAYVRPGNISLKLNLTNQNGTSATYEPAKIMNATARQHYIVTMDVSEGASAAILSVVFDSETEVQPITIDVSEEAMVAPAPYISFDGFSSGDVLNVQECEYAETGNVRATVTARGTIGGCTLMTESAYLLSLGFPTEAELTSLTAEQQSLMESLGLEMRGFGENRDKIGYIDFTELVPFLQTVGGGETDHTFTLSAKDVNGKVSEPVSFTIHSTPLSFTLQDIENVILGSTTADIPLIFSGKDAGQVQVLRCLASGMQESIPYEIVSQNGNEYVLRISLNGGNVPESVQAAYRGLRFSEVKSIGIDVPTYVLTCDESEVWSSRMTLHVEAENAEYQSVIEEYIRFFYLANGTWKEMEAVKTSRGYNISNLTNGTAYSLRGSCLTDLSDINNNVALDITTEDALSLPNAEFEDWTLWFSRTINKGGQYGKIAGWVQETELLESSNPDGWATVNVKTLPTSPQTENTWYMQPSTLPTSGVSGNGVLLRNVAWDSNGSTPARGSWGIKQSLESLTAPNISNRSAGKLFLGSYSYDHASGTEVYNEGIEFVSRPTKLTGYYKYTASGNDVNGILNITVEHRTASGEVIVLATKDVALMPTASYSAFEAALTYINTQYKATHLRIMFASSNNASYDQQEESANITTVAYKSEAVSRGSELCIDNLSLKY